MGRAAALAEYRVGASLQFEDLRFVRSSSAVAVALAWPADHSENHRCATACRTADIWVPGQPACWPGLADIAQELGVADPEDDSVNAHRLR